VARWGSGVGGSIHLDDLPDRVKTDIDRYMSEEARLDEQARVVDEASAKDYIERTLSRKAGLQPFVNNFSSGDYARILAGDHIQGLLSQNRIHRAGLDKPLDKNALRQAQELELKRPKRARKVDESRDARRIVPMTKEGFQRWRRSPGRLDVAGVDTRWKRPRIGRRGRILTPKRHSKWTRYVSSRGNYYVYRNKQGRFISDPEKRKS
jgi:hypothetical protein